MAKKIYRVASPVKHDGNIYSVGEPIELDGKQAAELVAVGAIDDEAIGEASDTPVVPTDPAARQAAIVEAIGKLDQENSNLWLRDGRPDAGAISEITGWNVSAAERNAAWASMQPA